ncbi:alpha-L-fucosidase [Maribacter vaceletii]|uniref:alpha-L-fucosidase n=1 Tax=Maribacter vaceletii TaxID=1206816 RepID=A0A495EBT9_9FLAO|nr:alpha-L-fucosidase [Maribacter vaceletii]RKR14079.1 alpha-L-fucosidase [Maribacter vaceletii]
MKNYLKSISLLLAIILLSCETKQEDKRSIKKEKIYYKTDWSSLQKHDTPQWMLDAKFGIYSHWGAQSVQLEMDKNDLPAYEAIKLWKGEKFKASEWVDLFQKAGAQFAGPVAWHVNGCLNWDSKITDWNSSQKGPKVDIYGELAKEIRKTDMKLMASFHSTTLWGAMSKTDDSYMQPEGDYSKRGNTPMVHGKKGRYTSEYLQGWLDRMKEGYELYEPDMVWVDVGFGGTVGPELRKQMIDGKIVETERELFIDGVREDIQREYISSYFNAALDWGKEVEFVYKSFDIPPGVAMRDIENGNLDGLQFDPWMADINMQQHMAWPSVWFYNPKNKLKDANILVDMLADITSKNGRILLNVPPKADGSFSEEIKKELLAIGSWLKLNGEAIYGTTPWTIYGEGPAFVKNVGHHGQGKKHGTEIPSYSSKDIRFTQKNGVIYAIILDWPEEEIVINSLGYNGKLYPGEIKNISLIGSTSKIKWEHNAQSLIVEFPKEKPCDFAFVLKIERNN